MCYPTTSNSTHRKKKRKIIRRGDENYGHTNTHKVQSERANKKIKSLGCDQPICTLLSLTPSSFIIMAFLAHVY